MATPLRILIVEDSDDDAQLLVRELKRGGVEMSYQCVDTPEQMHSALEVQEWDLVLSDYSMPGFSGEEALKILRNKSPDIPFIYVSGTLGEDPAVAALKSGAQDYLIKGKLGRLVPAIQREIREAEGRRQRQNLEARVHQLQRFEAIGRLAGGIAHDYNNVIGAILGWAEIAKKELPDQHITQARLQRIHDQAERAAGLTRQLLAFARRQVLQPRNLDLNTVVTETVALLGTLIGEQIQIQVSLAPGLEPVWADPSQVEQVVMNLCLNARDAMPAGGRLLIQTQAGEIGTSEQPPPPYFRAGKYILLSISDTGVGMDAKTMEHIFEPFFTTKEVGKGTGLGLATVYGIVRQHNGIIHVESEPHSGTKFLVYLPIGSGTPEAAGKMPEEQVQKGTETILVAEDHEGLREVAKEMLESLGYRVLLAKTGEEAVEVFREHHKSIDLVLLDVVMPAMNGPVAYERMLTINPNLRAIFASGYASEEQSLISVARKGVVHLQKPYGSKSLGQKVRALLDAPL